MSRSEDIEKFALSVGQHAFNHIYEKFIMNTTEQLEKQSREAVIAYLQDSSVQLEYLSKGDSDWEPKKHCGGDAFDFRYYYYRIAKPNPWYRVALFESGSVRAIRSEQEEAGYETNEYFIKWITERIEYEN